MITELVAPRKTAPQIFTGRCFVVHCEGRVFGLPVEHISTVFQVVTITPVPLGPPEVLGLINLRGKVVTALSLRRRLKRDQSEEPSRLAVGVDYNGESFALIVDEVGDVLQLDAGTAIERPPHLGHDHAKLISVHRVADQLLLPVLDLEWLFAIGTKAPLLTDITQRPEGRDA